MTVFHRLGRSTRLNRRVRSAFRDCVASSETVSGLPLQANRPRLRATCNASKPDTNAEKKRSSGLRSCSYGPVHGRSGDSALSRIIFAPMIATGAPSEEKPGRIARSGMPARRPDASLTGCRSPRAGVGDIDGWMSASQSG